MVPAGFYVGLIAVVCCEGASYATMYWLVGIIDLVDQMLSFEDERLHRSNMAVRDASNSRLELHEQFNGARSIINFKHVVIEALKPRKLNPVNLG